MFLTGEQVTAIAEISDGTAVTLGRTKGVPWVDVVRWEDALEVRVEQDGTTTTRREAKND